MQFCLSIDFVRVAEGHLSSAVLLLCGIVAGEPLFFPSVARLVGGVAGLRSQAHSTDCL